MAKLSAKGLFFTVVMIFFMSLCLRLAYLYYLNIDSPIRGDAYSYIQYAANLVNHGTFSKEASQNPIPDAYWAPGYPAFVAVVWFFSELTNVDTYIALLIVQAILGACLAVVTFLLGRLFLTSGWAFGASLLVSISPHLISLGGYVLTESLFALMLLSSLYCFSCAYIKRSPQWFTASGVGFGLAYLVNPVVLFVPIFISLAYVWGSIDKDAYRKNTRIVSQYVLLAFVIFVSGWQIRNAVNVPSNSASSSDRVFINLVIGFHHDFHQIWRHNPRDPNNPATLDMNRLGGSYSSFFDLFRQRFLEKPIHYLKWYLIQKPTQLWDWNILTGQGDVFVYPVKYSLYHVSKIALASHAIMKSLHFWLFGSALLSCVFMMLNRKRNASLIPIFLYVTLATISSVYVILQSEARYSIPMRPEMYLCAMYFMENLVRKFKQFKNAPENQ